MMLIATAILSVALYWIMLPTVRAQRFAAFVRAGQNSAAEAMLPDAIEKQSEYRHVLRTALKAELLPFTISQLLRGERRVVVGREWGGGDAEFIVSRTTVSLGTNWFNYL